MCVRGCWHVGKPEGNMLELFLSCHTGSGLVAITFIDLPVMRVLIYLSWYIR